jgi:hypothetical protein
VAVRKHLPSLAGLGRFADREPSHKWLGYFQKIKRDAVWRWLRAGAGKQARGDAKLFHLFDDEHFDWLAAGHEFEAELICQRLFQCVEIWKVWITVADFISKGIPVKVKIIRTEYFEILFGKNRQERQERQDSEGRVPRVPNQKSWIGQRLVELVPPIAFRRAGGV